MINDIVSELSDIAFHAHKKDIEVNVFSMYSSLYEEHKDKHGSFKFSDNYVKDMNSRYDWIVDNIWSVIENKEKYSNGRGNIY